VVALDDQMADEKCQERGWARTRDQTGAGVARGASVRQLSFWRQIWMNLGAVLQLLLRLVEKNKYVF